MDARRSGQWRGWQHYLSGRYCRAGGRLPAGLLRPGLHTFIIRGFDPLNDAREYGRELIPRLRAAVAGRVDYLD